MTATLVEKRKKLTTKERATLATDSGHAIVARQDKTLEVNKAIKTIGQNYCLMLNDVMTFDSLKDGVHSLIKVMSEFHVSVFTSAVLHKIAITKDADDKTKESAIQSARAGVSNQRNLLLQGLLCYHHNRDEAIRLTDATLRKVSDNKTKTPSEVAESISGKVTRLTEVNKGWLASLDLMDSEGRSLENLYKLEDEIQLKLNAIRDSIRGATENTISDIVPMDFKALFEKVKFTA